MQADRQTDRQTDILITILLSLPAGELVILLREIGRKRNLAQPVALVLTDAIVQGRTQNFRFGVQGLSTVNA